MPGSLPEEAPHSSRAPESPSRCQAPATAQLIQEVRPGHVQGWPWDGLGQGWGW